MSCETKCQACNAAEAAIRDGVGRGLWNWYADPAGVLTGVTTVGGRTVKGATAADLLDRLRRAVELDEDAKIRWDNR